MNKYSDNPLVSIIIPVYNAEKFLGNCLDSLIEQSYENLEIIIVDDGSNDNSEEIYNRYALKDKRIKVIKKENGGVSAARNTGMESASGELIGFVDADDIVKKDMFEKLVKITIKNSSDLSFCGFEVVGSNLRKNDTSALKKLIDKSNSVTKEKMINAIITTSEEAVYGYIWRSLYNSTMIKNNNIQFPRGVKISEDFMFLLKAVKCSDIITIIPEELYIYRINDASATSKFMPSIHEDMVFVNKWMFDSICNKYESSINGYYCCAANTYLSFVQNICRPGNPYNFIERMRLAKNTKATFGYMGIIKKVWTQHNNFRLKAWIAMVLFRFHLDFIYIHLFTIKEGSN